MAVVVLALPLPAPRAALFGGAGAEASVVLQRRRHGESFVYTRVVGTLPSKNKNRNNKKKGGKDDQDDDDDDAAAGPPPVLELAHLPPWLAVSERIALLCGELFGAVAGVTLAPDVPRGSDDAAASSASSASSSSSGPARAPGGALHASAVALVRFEDVAALRRAAAGTVLRSSNSNSSDGSSPGRRRASAAAAAPAADAAGRVVVRVPRALAARVYGVGPPLPPAVASAVLLPAAAPGAAVAAAAAAREAAGLPSDSSGALVEVPAALLLDEAGARQAALAAASVAAAAAGGVAGASGAAGAAGVESVLAAAAAGADDAPPSLLDGWLNEFRAGRQPAEDLMDEVEGFMDAYDAAKRAEALAVEARANVPDGEGFIEVMARGHKRSGSRDGTALRTATLSTEALVALKEQKDREHAADQFYTFQAARGKRDQLAALRQRFQEDKDRIARMRNARKFKPV